MGRAGIVLGLEVSRLARNSTDWHRLLEICALTDTLILDEDGVYDPAHFNDRLLLGLKGTMSEAELHVLRARLRGGILNKARRGELRCRLPVGLVYDGAGHVVLDPDQQVQESVRLLFATFARTGARACHGQVLPAARLLFPTRVRAGARKGELAGRRSALGARCQALHNPRYAGAYAFGRGRWRKQPDGQARRHERLPREQWHALHSRRPPGVHLVAGVRAQSAAAARWPRQGPRLRAPPQRPPREGPGLAAGARRLRRLRQPNARPLQHPSQR